MATFRRWWLGPLGAWQVFGLVVQGHHLAYGSRHGFGRYWLPYVVQRALATWWNPRACRRWGHAWYPDLGGPTWREPDDARILRTAREQCSACSAARPAPVPGYVVERRSA